LNDPFISLSPTGLTGHIPKCGILARDLRELLIKKGIILRDLLSQPLFIKKD
jgi:hypothetical protein